MWSEGRNTNNFKAIGFLAPLGMTALAGVEEKLLSSLEVVIEERECHVERSEEPPHKCHSERSEEPHLHMTFPEERISFLFRAEREIYSHHPLMPVIPSEARNLSDEPDHQLFNAEA